MRGSVRIGRVGGVPISMHWSLVVVVVLVALGLGHGLLPAAAPGLASAWYLLAGALGAVGFVVGIALHEAGHAVVARRQGLPVDGVTVWALGGFTEIDGEPATPGAELAVAGIGPLVSLVLGGLLIGVAVAAHLAGAPAVVGATVGWLGGLNLLLAALNALPAAPLDGGRILHAAVWRLTGSDRRAVLLSTAAGEVLGWVATVGGLLMVFAGNGEGLWIGATGLFVAFGASAQRQQSALRAVVAGRSVGDVMTPVAADMVPDWWDVDYALGVADLLRRGPAVVLQDWFGQPAGVVSPWHLLQVPVELRRSVQLRQLAWPMDAVTTADPDEDVLTLLRRWPAQAQVALVLDGGRPVGVLSVADVQAAVQRWLDGVGSPMAGRPVGVGSDQRRPGGQPSWPVPTAGASHR